MNEDRTLQINLSAGDAPYAAVTVPRLLRAHPECAERLLVVDACRQPRTRIFDPVVRLPLAAWQRRLTQVRELAEQLRAAGLADRVEILVPEDPRFAAWAARYQRPWMRRSHDYGGCAVMPYWAALELARSRYVVHYDADIWLHQTPGFDWAAAAIGALAGQPDAIAAAPRTSPPGFALDAPTLHEGRSSTRVDAGWLNDWFSTRCLLIDRARLDPHLPLIGRAWGAILAVRCLLDRGYPPAPEIILHRTLGVRGQRCLHLADPRAWLLHPIRKDAAYLQLLPKLADAVDRGEVPAAQRGWADIRVDEWQAWSPPV